MSDLQRMTALIRRQSMLRQTADSKPSVVVREHPILGPMVVPTDADPYELWKHVWNNVLTEEQRQTWLAVQDQQVKGKRLVSVPGCGSR